MAHDRTVSANLKSHLAEETTTLAFCYKIKRVDETEYFFTTHDATIEYDGQSYSPIGAGEVTDLKQTNTLSVDNQDLDLAFISVTAAELRAGLFDSAEIWTFKINYMAPADGIIKLVYGRLGEVEIKDNSARIEVRSLSQQLSTPIGKIFTPECHASLGDDECKIVMTSYTHNGVVVSSTDNKNIVIDGDAAGQDDDYYNYGKIKFTSGANINIEMQVEKYVSSTETITLLQPVPFTVAEDDEFIIEAGCDRRKESCISRFSNIINFRGFPDLPGLDKTIIIPLNREWTEFRD